MIERNGSSRSFAAVLFAALAAFGIVLLAGCGASKPAAGQIAATVNGTEISEADITSKVEGIRAQANLGDEESWGKWLASNNLTPEGVRKEIIDTFVEQALVKQEAETRGMTVEPAEVDGYVEKMRANYNDDGAWTEALAQAGFTEDEYRKTIETSLLQRQLSEALAADEEVTDDELNNYAKMYASYFSGAKRSSHILFATDDEGTAKEVLGRIEDGSLAFEDAAEEYSTDPGSKTQKGDVGWDKLNQFVPEYTQALGDLAAGQTSGLVTSEFGIHIIKCTEVFEAPEDVESIDQLPQEFQDAIRNMATSTKGQSAYQNWLAEAKEAADIVVNDMPKGLSYDVDMSKYPSKDDAAAASGAEGAAGDSDVLTPEDGVEGSSPNAGDDAPADGASGKEASEQPSGAEAAK